MKLKKTRRSHEYHKTEITTTVATINNSPPEENKCTQGVVVYFCESHNKSVYEGYYVRSTTGLFHRYAIELTQYEKYELRTGYLSQWTYVTCMPKDVDHMSKNNVLLLAGYELRNRNMNGIDVVEKSNMQNRSILVTGVNILQVNEFLSLCEYLKMSSKTFINDVSIVF
jgi:hypothetical protein